MISETVRKIRTDWAKSDAERDAGLTTPPHLVRHDDIAYGPHGEWNLLDIYHRDDTASPKPAIVSIHGGGWVYGNKETYQYYCMSLAEKGFTVVNFNYRLAPEHPYPAALTDVNQVFAFLAGQGKEYCVDVDRLFVVGDSAGAQLASQYLAALTNPGYARLLKLETPGVKVRAAALNCGMYDGRSFGEGEEELDELFWEYMGSKIGGLEVEAMDVMSYITAQFPPSFVMSAVYDFLRENARPMYEHLKGLGIDCRFKIYGTPEQREMGHVFHLNCKSREAAKCNEEECEFFREHLED